jgi:hypothetical protein
MSGAESFIKTMITYGLSVGAAWLFYWICNVHFNTGIVWFVGLMAGFVINSIRVDSYHAVMYAKTKEERDAEALFSRKS